MSSAGSLPTSPVQPLPPGLINTAPGSTTTVPGTTPTGASGPGAPVTGYNPAQATPANADVATYKPNAFTVNPNQTVASQLKDIIAAGSPLMQQAEATAKNQMNARGLINSTQAITAGQSAVIDKALPIATSDAATYDKAATNSTTAENTALASGAQATNTASLQDANNKTQASEYNAGQTNASLSSAATASNNLQSQAQQIAGSKDIAELQSNTQKAIADLQKNTTLTVEQMQEASAKLISESNNRNAVLVQQMSNDSSLTNIRANGEVNAAVTKLSNDNKSILQTSSSASQMYTQMLSSISAILTSNTLDQDQKATAANNLVTQLNDALSVMTQIANLPDVQSTLSFG